MAARMSAEGANRHSQARNNYPRVGDQRRISNTSDQRNNNLSPRSGGGYSNAGPDSNVHVIVNLRNNLNENQQMSISTNLNDQDGSLEVVSNISHGVVTVSSGIVSNATSNNLNVQSPGIILVQQGQLTPQQATRSRNSSITTPELQFPGPEDNVVIGTPVLLGPSRSQQINSMGNNLNMNNLNNLDTLSNTGEISVISAGNFNHVTNVMNSPGTHVGTGGGVNVSVNHSRSPSGRSQRSITMLSRQP